MLGRKTRTLLAALVAALVGASGSLGRAQDPPKETDDGLSRVRDHVAQLSRELESIRGRKFAHPVEVVSKNSDDYRALYARELSQSLTAERSHRLSRALVRLGLLPAGYDLRDSDIESAVLATNLEFNREDGSIWAVKTDVSDHVLDYGAFLSLGYAHEYQCVDMKKFLTEGSTDRDDVLNARRFLVEGEVNYLENIREARAQGAEDTVPDHLDGLANLTRSEFAELQRHPSGAAAADDAKSIVAAEDHTAKLPAFVYHALIDPPLKGAALIGKLVRTGGWPAVDEVWKHPPTSTAQVLHWKKLSAPREEPIRIELPDLSPKLGDGVRRSLDDTLGELGLKSFLEELGVAEKEVPKLARAWRGDRLAAFEKDGAAADASETTVAWCLTFESDVTARRVYEALSTGMAKREPKKSALTLKSHDVFLVVSSRENLPELAKTLGMETKKVVPGNEAAPGNAVAPGK